MTIRNLSLFAATVAALTLSLSAFAGGDPTDGTGSNPPPDYDTHLRTTPPPTGVTGRDEDGAPQLGQNPGTQVPLPQGADADHYRELSKELGNVRVEIANNNNLIIASSHSSNPASYETRRRLSNRNSYLRSQVRALWKEIGGIWWKLHNHEVRLQAVEGTTTALSEWKDQEFSKWKAQVDTYMAAHPNPSAPTPNPGTGSVTPGAGPVTSPSPSPEASPSDKPVTEKDVQAAKDEAFKKGEQQGRDSAKAAFNFLGWVAENIWSIVIVSVIVIVIAGVWRMLKGKKAGHDGSEASEEH